MVARCPVAGQRTVAELCRCNMLIGGHSHSILSTGPAILQTAPSASYDPSMGMPRALWGAVAVLVVALLAACQPRPAPEGAAQAYLDAWARADYGAMYALV